MGEICGNQHIAQECYVNALKETLHVDTINPREHETNWPKLMGNLEAIYLSSVDQIVQIAKILPLDLKR